MSSQSQPTIILLNGTSSAGKTSLAQALQSILNEPFLYYTADIRKPMLPPYREGLGWNVPQILDRLRTGYWRSAAAFYEAGNCVIADQAIEEPEWMQECAGIFAPLNAYLIGVHCSLEEAIRREQSRGDRTVGLVSEQFEKVHRHGIYDCTVETTHTSSLDCAQKIKEHIASTAPSAFRFLAGQAGLHQRKSQDGLAEVPEKAR